MHDENYQGVTWRPRRNKYHGTVIIRGKARNVTADTAKECAVKLNKLCYANGEELLNDNEREDFTNKKLDESDRSDSLGVGLEIYIGKKKSGITSSNLNEDNIKTLIERCIETTKITPEDEFNSLPDQDLLATKINDLKVFNNNLNGISINNATKIFTVKSPKESVTQGTPVA